jgi:hypothetical protein
MAAIIKVIAGVVTITRTSTFQLTVLEMAVDLATPPIYQTSETCQ